MFFEYDTNWDGKASRPCRTEFQQQRPHSKRVFRALERDGEWELRRRIDGKVSRTLKSTRPVDKIAWAAWICADPGTQFSDTTINEWATCLEDGRINASNLFRIYVSGRWPATWRR